MNDGFLNDQADLLELIANKLHEHCFHYFVNGSQAYAVYGEPRFTQDIDIVLEISEAQIPLFLSAFRSDAFYLSETAVRSAVGRRGMFNLIQPATGGKVDFIVAKDSDFDRSRMDRVRSLSIGENVKATFASPEDVILKKMQWFAKDNSDRHVRDILGMLHVQSSSIDHAYIDAWVVHLDVGEIWKWIKARLKVSNPTYE
jgi:hypothetical protein